MNTLKNILCAMVIACMVNSSASAEISIKKASIKPIAKVMTGVGLAAASLFSIYIQYSLFKYESIWRITGKIILLPFQKSKFLSICTTGALGMSAISGIVLGRHLVEEGIQDAKEVMPE